jgi:DNA-binding NtrC family response regulator
MLKGRTILIVEDEPLVAFDLADMVEGQGGIVAGPVPTVEEGLSLAASGLPAAAILDANLEDCDVTQLALALIESGTPFVIYTGTGLPDALARLHPDLPVVMKPTQTRLVLEALDRRIELGHPVA